jgi:hypothetical protein
VWYRIDKNSLPWPSTGTYRDWKPQLADEGHHQCVYCSISEASFGGLRNFHVEHYKPKAVFPEFENEYGNLFFACAICNSFKRDDWPGECDQDLSEMAYPNPASVNIGDYIDVNSVDGEVTGTRNATKYLIERLFLNRPQLILERRTGHAFARLDEMREHLSRVADQTRDVQLLQEIVRRVNRVAALFGEYRRAIPYKNEDTKRNAAAA